MSKKFKIILAAVVLIMIAGIFFIPRVIKGLENKMAAEAAGGLPYQIGLTSVTVTNCLPSCIVNSVAFCCAPQTGLCPLVIPKESYNVDCPLYSAVSGSPAGGMGSQALFLNTALAQAGVTSGGQLIAGGISPALMDSGVLAGPGGCYNCFAKEDGLGDKLVKYFKVFIAGIKD